MPSRQGGPEVPPTLTVDTFADRYDGEDGVASLAVVEDGTVLGVIGMRRLQRLGRRQFAATRAADVMATPPDAPFLAPDDDLWPAVGLMDRRGLEGLAVVAGREAGGDVDAGVDRGGRAASAARRPRPAGGGEA